MIVDTSNEIGGDGDVPHPAIGAARRMQVADATRQHDVMVSALAAGRPAAAPEAAPPTLAGVPVSSMVQDDLISLWLVCYNTSSSHCVEKHKPQ